MAKTRRVGMLLVGALVWMGLCQVGSQVPSAGARQGPRDDGASWRAEVLPTGEAVEMRSHLEQPATILHAVPAGQTVRKGDLIVELDASALIDKRIQQVVQVRRAEGGMIRARQTLEWETRAAQGQMLLAEKALRLAQSQLKAYTEGEYPHQLALAEGAAAIAKERFTMADERVHRVQADFKAQKDRDAIDALQEAQLTQQEARMQAHAAESSLSILKSFVHDNKVAELELAVAQREFDLLRAKDADSAARTQGEANFSLAEMEYQVEKDRLAKLDDEIVKSKIYAPRDGVVAYSDDPGAPPIRVGTVVRDRQVLLRLLPAPRPKP